MKPQKRNLLAEEFKLHTQKETQFVLPPTKWSQVAKRLVNNRSPVSSKLMQLTEQPIPCVTMYRDNVFLT